MKRSFGGAPVWGLVSEESVVPGLTAVEVSDLTSSVDAGGSPTQQQFREEVDVNVIVSRFGVGRQVAVDTMGVYGDFTGIFDYESALARIEGAQARFMSLPAEVRERFQNDPGRLVRAAQDLSEEDFAKLMDPPKVEAAPPPVPAVP